jgi:hypothetical protein
MWQIEHTNDGTSGLETATRRISHGRTVRWNRTGGVWLVECNGWRACRALFIRLKNRWRGGYLHIESVNWSMARFNPDGGVQCGGPIR